MKSQCYSCKFNIELCFQNHNVFSWKFNFELIFQNLDAFQDNLTLSFAFKSSMHSKIFEIRHWVFFSKSMLFMILWYWILLPKSYTFYGNLALSFASEKLKFFWKIQHWVLPPRTRWFWKALAQKTHEVFMNKLNFSFKNLCSLWKFGTELYFQYTEPF